MCEEHRRAHGKTRVTKGHTVTHVRNLRLTEEMVTVEEEAEVPLVLPLVAAARRTRHPEQPSKRRKKITELI